MTINSIKRKSELFYKRDGRKLNKKKKDKISFPHDKILEFKFLFHTFLNFGHVRACGQLH